MKEPELLLIGRYIRKLRKEQGYSQEEFAATADISERYYGGIERGEHNLTYLCLLKIIHTLKLDEVIFFKNKPSLTAKALKKS